MEHTKFASIRETAKMGPLSEFCLRLMLKQGRLPGVFSGKKFLVNYDRLIEQLDAESRKCVIFDGNQQTSEGR